MEILVDVETFFWLQHIEENGKFFFNRYDLIVRILAIDNYYGLNDFGFDLYLKMQNIRKLTHKYIPDDVTFETNGIIALIKSFEKEGFKEDYPIHVNRFMELVDGSHRFSLALYKNIKKIPIILSSNMYDCRFYYGINWFQENGFNNHEIDIIQNKYKMIKELYIKHYLGIIWSPAIQFADEILNEIGEKFVVIDCEDIEFSDEIDLEKFIRNIYKFDIIAQEKIRNKIQIIKKYKPIVKVFRFNAYVRDFFKRIVDDRLVSVPTDVNSLKEDIRRKISVKIKDYYYDIIIHINDNEIDYYGINEVVNVCKDNMRK